MRSHQSLLRPELLRLLAVILRIKLFEEPFFERLVAERRVPAVLFHFLERLLLCPAAVSHPVARHQSALSVPAASAMSKNRAFLFRSANVFEPFMNTIGRRRVCV